MPHKNIGMWLVDELTAEVAQWPILLFLYKSAVYLYPSNVAYNHIWYKKIIIIHIALLFAGIHEGKYFCCELFALFFILNKRQFCLWLNCC